MQQPYVPCLVPLTAPVLSSGTCSYTTASICSQLPERASIHTEATRISGFQYIHRKAQIPVWKDVSSSPPPPSPTFPTQGQWDPARHSHFISAQQAMCSAVHRIPPARSSTACSSNQKMSSCSFLPWLHLPEHELLAKASDNALPLSSPYCSKPCHIMEWLNSCGCSPWASLLFTSALFCENQLTLCFLF